MQGKGFGEHVMNMGDYLTGKLRGLQNKYEIIGDVRGIGLMVGMELVKDRTTKVPARNECNAVLSEAFRRGLTLLMAGESVIRFSPPLILEKEDIDAGMEILDAAFAAVGS
jgi:4-aminobutyrate aminotransferase-like enzyme